MVWPVFKTAMETPPVAPVGSIPTRSRHLLLRPLLVLCICLLALGSASHLHAQASPQTRKPAAPADLKRQPISPSAALWRSLLLPGWGQARLNRKLSAGLFVAWEAVTLGMTLKTENELRYLRRTASARADDKRQEHEDWLVLLGFNHVLAGLEAYVSAHLADFPGDLQFQAVPGGVGAAVSVPVRIR